MADTMIQEATGKIPVMQVVKEAYAFFAANWVRLLPAAALAAAIAAGVTALLGGGATVSLGGALISGIASAVAGLTFAAAVLRLALRGEFVGPVGLTLGQDEFRLMGVAAGLTLAFAPPVFLALMAFSFIIVGRMNLTPEDAQRMANDPEAMQRAIEDALGPGGLMMISIAILVGLLILFWVGARLFLVQAATMGERRMVAFQTWGWTRGNVSRVIFSILLALMPPLLAATIITEVVWAAVGAAPTQPAYAAALAIASFVDLLAQIPAIALGAILYRGLRPPDFQPK